MYFTLLINTMSFSTGTVKTFPYGSKELGVLHRALEHLKFKLMLLQRCNRYFR